MTRISSTAKLPLKIFIGKGSYKERLEYAKLLNKSFYDRITPKIKDNKISVIDYKNTLNEILPDNIKFHIMNIDKISQNNGYLACLSIMYQTDLIKQYFIKLPYIYKFGKNNKTAQLHLNTLSLMIHENFHLFASISNPKHAINFNFNSDKDAEIYNKCLYGSCFGFSPIKIREILKHLKKKSSEDKISFLQTCRYRLIEENLAHQEEQKYGKRKFDLNIFAFDEKIKFIEILLAKNLKKARHYNKKLLQSKSSLFLP